MNTRSQTRVSRYFTAAEVEANEAIQEAKDTGKGKEKEVVLGLSNILHDDETIEVDLDNQVQRKTMILSLNVTLLTTKTKTLIRILIEIKTCRREYGVD
jgi:hypothetical protein